MVLFFFFSQNCIFLMISSRLNQIFNVQFRTPLEMDKLNHYLQCVHKKAHSLNLLWKMGFLGTSVQNHISNHALNQIMGLTLIDLNFKHIPLEGMEFIFQQSGLSLHGRWAHMEILWCPCLLLVANAHIIRLKVRWTFNSTTTNAHQTGSSKKS